MESPPLSNRTGPETLIKLIDQCKSIRAVTVCNVSSFFTICNKLLHIVSSGSGFDEDSLVGKSTQIKTYLTGLVNDGQEYVCFDKVVEPDTSDSAIEIFSREILELAPDIQLHQAFIKPVIRAMAKTKLSLARMLHHIDEDIPVEFISKRGTPVQVVLGFLWQNEAQISSIFKRYYMHHYDWVGGDLVLRQYSKRFVLNRKKLSQIYSWDEIHDETAPMSMIRFMQRYIPASCDHSAHITYDIPTNQALRHFIINYSLGVTWNKSSDEYEVENGSEQHFIARDNILPSMVSFVKGLNPSSHVIHSLGDDLLVRYFRLHYGTRAVALGLGAVTHRDIEIQMKILILGYVPESFIGDISIMSGDSILAGDVLRTFFTYYADHVTWNGSAYCIKEGAECILVQRSDLVDKVKLATEGAMNKHEQAMNTPGWGIGGTYQTTRWKSLIDLFTLVDRVLVSMFGAPRHPSRFVTFDVGCGENRPMWILSNVFGHATIGQEICPARSLIAARAGIDMIEHDYGRQSKVALFCGDATETANWTGVHCFYIWDVAFNVDTTEDMFRNIARALAPVRRGGPWSDGRLHQVLLVVSLRHSRRTKLLMGHYFQFEAKSDPVSLDFKCDGGVSTVQLFRLVKKQQPCYSLTPIPTGPGVVDESRRRFFSPTKRKIEYESLEGQLEIEAARSKEQRKYKARLKQPECEEGANVIAPKKKKKKTTPKKKVATHTKKKAASKKETTSKKKIASKNKASHKKTTVKKKAVNSASEPRKTDNSSSGVARIQRTTTTITTTTTTVSATSFTPPHDTLNISSAGHVSREEGMQDV